MRVPFVSIDRQYKYLRNELEEAFHTIGSSGLYIMGQALEEFENEISEYCETDYALGVASGSDALFLTLKAMGIGEGDDPIVVGINRNLETNGEP